MWRVPQHGPKWIMLLPPYYRYFVFVNQNFVDSSNSSSSHASSRLMRDGFSRRQRRPKNKQHLVVVIPENPWKFTLFAYYWLNSLSHASPNTTRIIYILERRIQYDFFFLNFSLSVNGVAASRVKVAWASVYRLKLLLLTLVAPQPVFRFPYLIQTMTKWFCKREN